MGFYRGQHPRSLVVMATVLRLSQYFLVGASVNLLNATQFMTDGVGNTNYDHQVILQNNANDPLDDVLVFRWDDPSDGILNASLEHTTTTESNKPSWIALGFFDELRNTEPVFGGVLEQVNGQAVVGTLFFGSLVQRCF